jgi:hypothetical protein
MPDFVIKKVKHFGCRGGPAGTFNFADRSEILFEWNDNVEKSSERRITLYHISR